MDDFFDPSAVGLRNGRFIGLPYSSEQARVVLIPLPWDVSVSFGAGTADGPANVLESSYQLDLEDPLVPNAYKMGLHFLDIDKNIRQQSAQLRISAAAYIDYLESGGDLNDQPVFRDTLVKLNEQCRAFKHWVYDQSNKWLDQGKLVGVVGGDHSTPLGFIEALAERHKQFGILHLDAHLDLRQAYEGFTYSHASIMYNVLTRTSNTSLVSVGIRDYCREELDFADQMGKRVVIHTDHSIRQDLYRGQTLLNLAKTLHKQLPKKIYISFDIDALLPYLCPNTGTPVPGGLEYQEAIFLIEYLVIRGHQIIGFDLSEVAGLNHAWDGNVGARILYRLSNLMGRSAGLI
jgi:agmatinase